MQPNEIQYQLTPQDLIRASKAHLKALHVRWVLGGGGLFFLAGGLLGLGVGGDTSDSVFSILLGVFFLIGISWLMAIQIRRRFRREPALNKPIVVAIDTEGLQMSGHHFTGKEDWAAYGSYLETPELFLLYICDPRQFSSHSKAGDAGCAGGERIRRVVSGTNWKNQTRLASLTFI
jgi:hypothetical protein